MTSLSKQQLFDIVTNTAKTDEGYLVKNNDPNWRFEKHTEHICAICADSISMLTPQEAVDVAIWNVIEMAYYDVGTDRPRAEEVLENLDHLKQQIQDAIDGIIGAYYYTTQPH